MNDAEAAALYRLMTWLSPAFPVGAFSYSSGIEWAVEAGDIDDAASLRDWLAAMLADGSRLLRRRVSGPHPPRRFAARRARLARSRRACRRLRAVARAPARDHGAGPRLHRHRARGLELRWPRSELIARCGGTIVYPVAVGLVSSAHAIPLAPTLHAFFHALASNWISAGARLVPLGQTDSQRLLAALEPVVVATAKRARDAALDDLGSATFRADLASMRHETQYTRLFRS